MKKVDAFYHPEASTFCAWAPAKKNIELILEHTSHNPHIVDRVRIIRNFSPEKQTIHQPDLINNADFQMLYSDGQMITDSTMLMLNPFGINLFEY